MSENTDHEVDVTRKVRAAARLLNDALHEASQAKLRCEIDVTEHQVFGKEWPDPFVSVRVMKELRG